MIINLNQSNQVDYKGLRQGNAFGFSFELLLNEVPIVADDYSVLLEIYRNFQKVHSVVDWEWTRVDNEITKLYDSFPLDAADYKFHCTLTNTDDQQTTYVNGTIQVIDKYAVYTGTENNEEIQANVNAGIPGPAGEGVPAGGDTGQVLAKASGDDYDTEWVEQSGGGGGGTWGSITGTLSDQTDLQAALDAKLSLTGGTMTGSITLAENAGIALDPAGSADGKWSGITLAGTAGYTQAFGDVVYLDPTDSRWEQCDANSASGADGDCRGIVGIVVSAGTDGTACTILLRGIIRADAKFPALTINGPVYISETAGALVQTAPSTSGAIVRRLGTAITADEIYFNPSEMYLTVM